MNKLLFHSALWIILLNGACMADSRNKNTRDTIYQASTTLPVTQSRDSKHYKWLERHQEILKLNKVKPPKNILIGNSIIHYWGGEPGHRTDAEKLHGKNTSLLSRSETWALVQTV